MHAHALKDLYVCTNLLSCTTKNIKGASKTYNVMVKNLKAQK